MNPPFPGGVGGGGGVEKPEGPSSFQPTTETVIKVKVTTGTKFSFSKVSMWYRSWSKKLEKKESKYICDYTKKTIEISHWYYCETFNANLEQWNYK